jgi:hypothetical protein
MSAVAAQVPQKCPACGTYTVPGRGTCLSCGMETAKMAEFLAAQRAAGAKGIKVKKFEDPEEVAAEEAQAARMAWVKRAVAAVVLIALGVGGYWAFVGGGAKAEPWAGYPNDRDELVKQFFGYIHDDTDVSAKKAYALISRGMKNPAKEDEAGLYFQNFHDLTRYMNDAFGHDWYDTMRIEHTDGKGAGQLRTTVYIQTETLHVPLDLQGPDGMTIEQLAARPAVEHRYGVRAIEEFPISSAGKSQQMEAISGILGGVYGATGSVNQIRGIVGASGSPPHETPMECKRRLFPLVRNPKMTALNRALHQLWPVRNDPTVRATLEAIMGDERYDPQMRAIAKRVHDGTEDEESLVADGVNING